MKRLQAVIFALSLLPCTSLFAVDSDAVLGGAIGGGVGAAIGSKIGGREGAVVGSGVGAAVGTAIATDGKRRGSGHDGTDEHRHYEKRGHHDVEYEPRRHRHHARPKIPWGHMPPPGHRYYEKHRYYGKHRYYKKHAPHMDYEPRRYRHRR
jgi:hypothetical protein